MENRTDEHGKQRIGGKERDVGNFHDLVIHRRNGRAVTAIDDVGEPVAVMLNERSVTIAQRPLGRRNHANGDPDLRESKNEGRDETLE